MIRRVVLSIIVAIVTWILVALVGYGLVEAGISEVGSFVRGVAPLLGVLAGIWYFFAGPTDRIA